MVVKHKLDTTKILITLCPDEFASSSGSCSGENYTPCRIKRCYRFENREMEQLYTGEQYFPEANMYGKHEYRKNLDDDTA